MVQPTRTVVLLLCLARPSRQGIVDVLRSTQIEVLVDVILVGFNGDGRDALQGTRPAVIQPIVATAASMALTEYDAQDAIDIVDGH